MRKSLLTIICAFCGTLMAFSQSEGQYEQVFFEDFNKWTAGTNDAPDATDLGLPENEELQKSLMTSEGNWTVWHAFQAGGCAYFSLETDESGADPGYMMTPPLDLRSDNGGYFRFTCKAKRAANGASPTIQLLALDDDPVTKGQIYAEARTLSYEWEEYEWISGGGREYTTFMFLGWQGGVLVDDVKVEKINYLLPAPSISAANLTAIDNVEVKFTAVEGAENYRVSILDDDIDKTVLATVTVGAEATSANLNVVPAPKAKYYVTVTALAGTAESPAAKKQVELSPSRVGDGVALAATNVTESGFTANWEPADFARQYLLGTTYKYTAKEDGEEFAILDEDFIESIDPMYTDTNPIIVSPMFTGVTLDYVLSRTGWYTDIVLAARQLFCMTDMYAAYGMKSNIISPAADFSVGNGEVHISGLAYSAVDDMVITAAFIDENGEIISSTDIDIAPIATGGTMIDATLTGGKPNSRIKFFISDEATPGADMAAFYTLKITTSLNKGETIELPIEKHVLPYDATSFDMALDLSGDNKATYTVQPFFYAGGQEPGIVGAISNEILVDYAASIGKAFADKSSISVANGQIVISNADNAEVKIFSVDGAEVMSSSSSHIACPLTRGVYVVAVNGKTVKVTL